MFQTLTQAIWLLFGAFEVPIDAGLASCQRWSSYQGAETREVFCFCHQFGELLFCVGNIHSKNSFLEVYDGAGERSYPYFRMNIHLDIK